MPTEMEINSLINKHLVDKFTATDDLLGMLLKLQYDNNNLLSHIININLNHIYNENQDYTNLDIDNSKIFAGNYGVTLGNAESSDLVTCVINGRPIVCIAKSDVGQYERVIVVPGGSDTEPHIVALGILIKGNYEGTPKVVATDESGNLISEIVGSEGIPIKQEATGELVSVIQGSEGIDIKQKATTGELVAELVGSEGNPILQSAITNALIAVMTGDQGIAIAQEAATGEMIAIFKALYGSSLITVAADANGRLSADFGLYEQATFDMDTYADGTDSRISFSSIITMNMIKYWINVQSNLIAIRHIDVQGSASLGEYSLTLAANDVVSGSTGINTPSVDTKIYRKTISSLVFDYSESNCLFKGCIIDLLKGDDNSDNYSLVTGGGNAPNAYDDDLTTSAYYAIQGTTYTTVLEVSFDSISISESHLGLDIKDDSVPESGQAYAKLQLNVNSVWTDVIILTLNVDTYTFTSDHDITTYNLVTGARIQLKHSFGTSSWSSIKIRDFTLVPA